MLKQNDLKLQIKSGLSSIYKPAIERIILMMFPNKSKMGDKLAKEIADTFDELTSDAISDIISSAIDSYVKNITITGTLITAGAPTTQTCVILPAATPAVAGKIPNTLGIS